MAVEPAVDSAPWQEEGATPLVKIQGITKNFGDFTAVDNVDLNIYPGELFCLLGGSGCGKTTLLRMMAGFQEPTSGTISIDGIDMANVPPYERPTNMMFQSYALFPHMTVEKNIAFGLKQDKLANDLIGHKVHEILKLVELEEFKKRKPQQLSGGQRQRVALARALVKEPKLLLLDEPLGALDKKLREQTQFELMNIQEQVGITFVVVTHDQEEAMTLSTRIAVMDAGKFVQIGTPTEIYEFPDSRFVANFIGSANILEGQVTKVASGSVEVETQLGKMKVDNDQLVEKGNKVWVAIRPEKISLSKEQPKKRSTNQAEGVVDDIGYLGDVSIYKVRMSSGLIVDVTAPNLIRPKNRTHRITWEDTIYLDWSPSSVMLLTR